MIFQNQKNAFLGIKTRSPKTRKIDIFPNGLTHGFGPKMAIFATFFFQALQARKMFLMIFYNEKMPFQAIKRSPKSRKIDIFYKGLTRGFGPKMAILATFFIQALQARKMFLMIFQNEKTPFQAMKTKSPKSRKIHIFPKGLTHGFGPKMAIFATFVFQPIQARKMSFMIFQNKKTPLQGIKTRSPKSRKIDIFPNGLTHGFGPKMAIFATFFFQAIQARKMSFMISQNEETFFQAIKTRSPKSRKN